MAKKKRLNEENLNLTKKKRLNVENLDYEEYRPKAMFGFLYIIILIVLYTVYTYFV